MVRDRPHHGLLASPLRAGGRGRAPRILGPGMLGVAAAQLLADLGVGAFPEAAQVPRRLHRATVGRQQQEGHRLAAGSEGRRVGQAEQVLQLDRGDDRPVVSVVESRATSARHGNRIRREFPEPSARLVRQPGQQVGLEQPTAADALPAYELRHVDIDTGERFRQPGTTVAYLPQETAFAPDETVAEHVATDGAEPHRADFYLSKVEVGKPLSEALS